MGNVSKRPLVQEGQPSTNFHNSKNSASSSEELRHDITETARKERERKRDSLNALNQSPHFHGRSGMLNHIGGTYSHGGMMNYPTIPLSEWNLGKVPDSMEFQSWKCNFRPEDCSRTADPQVTMFWIKEVEIATSIDELVTSRSNTGQPNFPDFNVLDAMIVSALKKLLHTQSNFRQRVSVEQQRAPNSDRFLRGRQISHMIYEHFRATGAYEAAQGVADLFTMRLQNDDVQDFDVRWDHAQLTVIGFYKSKLQNSDQLQTEAFYDEELARNNGIPNYQQFKTAVKLHNDQMMRNRIFRVRSDVVERR